MELREYFRVLRSRWVGVTVFLLIGVLGSAGWTLLQPRVYTAHASGYLAARGATDLGASMVDDQLAQSKIKSYLDIDTWRSVAEYAISQLHLHTTPNQLFTQGKVPNPANTVVLQVAASASTPHDAQALAQAWIQGIVQQINQTEKAIEKTPPVTVVPGDSAR